VARTVFTKLITKTRYNLGAVSQNTVCYKTTKIVCHVTTTVNRLVIILYYYTILYHTVLLSTVNHNHRKNHLSLITSILC